MLLCALQCFDGKKALHSLEWYFDVTRYDSHRDAILRSGNHHQAGGSGGVEAAEKPDNDFNIYMYYSASCHTGHHDGIKVNRCLHETKPFSSCTFLQNVVSVAC